MALYILMDVAEEEEEDGLGLICGLQVGEEWRAGERVFHSTRTCLRHIPFERQKLATR